MLVDFNDAPGLHLLQLSEAAKDEELDVLLVAAEESDAEEPPELKVKLHVFGWGRLVERHRLPLRRCRRPSYSEPVDLGKMNVQAPKNIDIAA